MNLLKLVHLHLDAHGATSHGSVFTVYGTAIQLATNYGTHLLNASNEKVQLNYNIPPLFALLLFSTRIVVPIANLSNFQL